jgi:protein-S-isoprenylcysteine O-methyltransferase Ste14
VKTTVPLPFVYPYVIVFVVAYLLAFYQEWAVLGKRKPKPGETRPQDRGSYAVVVWGIVLSIVVACFCAARVHGAAIKDGRLVCFWAGIVIMVFGGYLRRYCFRLLGEHFQPVVNVVVNQPVIEKGLYRWIRHPSYLAAFFLFLGVGLVLGNWLSLAVIFLATAICYGYRIHVEEQALCETIGAPYREYMKRTKRLIPFVY